MTIERVKRAKQIIGRYPVLKDPYFDFEIPAANRVSNKCSLWNLINSRCVVNVENDDPKEPTRK